MKHPLIFITPFPEKFILVTGDAGYIGNALVKFLIERKYACVGYDGVNGLDITDNESLNSMFEKYNIDCVIHLAAMSSVPICEENPEKAYKVNVEGTKNIINTMKKHGCSKIIFASTSSVYEDSNEILTEKSKICPNSVYAITKYESENIVANSGLKYVILRMFNVVGGNNIQNFGYDRLFSSLVSGKITVYGFDYDTKDGTCVRDYVDIIDVCRSYELSLEYLDKIDTTSTTINISTSIGTSVLEIINLWKHKLKVSYSGKRKGDKAISVGSNSLALSNIKWFPEHTIAQTINKMCC